MAQIIAFDPGLTTGLAIIEENAWWAAQYTFRQIGDVLAEWTHNPEDTFSPGCVLVCESFTITQKTARNSQAPWSLEVIGLIRYMAMVNHLELVFQQPSAAKNLIKDQVIKNAGMWKPGQEHAMDAVRHCLLYAVTQKGKFREALIQCQDEY